MENMTEKTAMQYFTEKGLSIGWNLGNTLDAMKRGTAIAEETGWDNPMATQTLFDGVKSLGFKIARIPITWMGHIGPAPDFKVSRDRLKRVGEIVNYAKNAGFDAVIINIHHDDSDRFGWLLIREAAKDQEKRKEITAQFTGLWTQIAEYFKGHGHYLIFESMNEVNDGRWCHSDEFVANPKIQMDIINQWNQVFTDAVRGTGSNNEKRFLVYPSYSSNAFCLLPDGVHGSGVAAGQYFKLPVDSVSGRQIVTFHYYDPFRYAADAFEAKWDTTAFREDAENQFKRFKAPFLDKGIPVIIGEMGPRYRPNQNPDRGVVPDKTIYVNNRIPYIKFVYAKAREHGLIPVFWDDGGMFQQIDRNSGQPADEHCASAIQAMMDAVE